VYGRLVINSFEINDEEGKKISFKENLKILNISLSITITVG